MSSFSVDLVRRFNEPVGALYRAFDHLIGARPGMTLMVPIAAATGRFDGLVDQCPVPHLEAAAILEPEYADAEPLYLTLLMSKSFWRRIPEADRQQLMEMLISKEKICAYDAAWRYVWIQLCTGGKPCLLLIGETGVRLAYAP
ncbi:hypothetical protein EDC30_109126 [Paucimonas lemoignei]|uniref:Uncharacterized protein n=1 Tax=Paucimonas lemoignei TaxID=29443 RepID=A0A4R3HRS5_PAULE|nr:hypothetical protein [Paucimonas lemoignei]TCS35827.1 hypothetical protein EDC30_109126 [Paucimonas lemoignei]